MKATMSVEAKVRYMHPKFVGAAEMPEIGSRETRRSSTAVHFMPVADARPLVERGELGLDTTGFVLDKLRSEVRDFRDDGQIRVTYYPEIEELVLRLTGAANVFTMGHVVRTEKPIDFNNAYARFVHCDYTASNADSIAKMVLEQHGSDLDPAQWDFVWYNTWQPFDREVQQNPLTLLDASSLKQEDLLDYLYTGDGDANVSVMPVHREGHRFYFFPRMQTDEIMVFKQLETRSKAGLPCPHTSFDDMTAPDDALGRRSVEVRVMCAFPRAETT
jgi:hypothetical protein